MKYFGVLAGFIVGFGLIFISILLPFDILFVNAIGKIPIYFWIGLILTFFLFVVFNKSVKRTVLNGMYFTLAILSFIYINSMFQWSVECCPEKYDSMVDWNASVGLSWIISLPVSFVFLIFQGLVYDFFCRRKFEGKSNASK